MRLWIDIFDGDTVDVDELVVNYLYCTGIIAAPNATNHGCYLNFPYKGNSSSYVEIPEILDIWDAKFGGLEAKVTLYTVELQQQSLDLVYHNTFWREGYDFLIDGNDKLCQLLTDANIAFTNASIPYTSGYAVGIYPTYVLPFFQANLDAPQGPTGKFVPGYPLGSLFFFCGLVILVRFRRRS
jgi:hypothetical protein